MTGKKHLHNQNNNIMRVLRIFSGITLLLMIIIIYFSSCTDAQEEKIGNTADTLENKIERGVDELRDDFEDLKDDVFVSNILEDNGKLLEMLEKGKVKGTHITLKIDSMMSKHTMIQEQFETYAEQHGINYRVNNKITDLDEKNSGVDWDREWREELYDLHNTLLNKCERKHGRANDPELERIVNNTLPVLREHLNMMDRR